MEQKNCLRMIYKIHTSELKRANWNLVRPLDEALKSYPDSVVSISDSQALRFIDKINGVENFNEEARKLKRKIKRVKKDEKSLEQKREIKRLYHDLRNIQFQKDYITIVMDSDKDFDRANKGFSINFGMNEDGVEEIIHYKRFLGTSGGIKKSTIVYVNERIYSRLKEKLDNGRKMDIPLVPAKLEAYQALVCSGSSPLPPPKGFIVVNDCITHFKEDVILLDDSADGEPVMTKVQDYDIEHNDSDGYGLMSPEYARIVNKYLYGKNNEQNLSGMNTRYAWTKGMLYTFDFVEFAEKIAGSYMIKDAWGAWRDVRKADVILTVSMLKLWDSYDSWESYFENCQKNGYEFSVAKTAPHKLETVRDTNYQFLQSYEFTDEEIEKLCEPTINEIQDVLGLDYRKSLAFLIGYGANDGNVLSGTFDYCAQALMADERMINDPYIRRKLHNMIKKRIEMGERGAIRIDANFAMLSGDPYALCQNMFGLEVMGLLNKGEIYHKYWIDKGSEFLACFRAPMTCHNNIRRMKLANSEEISHWYQYIQTCVISNAFDTMCDALNGADKDGDLLYCTDNEIIVKKTKNSPTIMCIQHKAEKVIPTEESIVTSNKLGFSDDIGIITNHITSMIEVQAGYSKGTKEFNTLEYRIMASQGSQQNAIDKIKGIIAKPMPPSWYSIRDNVERQDDSKEEKERKRFYMSITAARKPYFMIYVYPHLKKQVRDYEMNCLRHMRSQFRSYGFKSMDEMKNFKSKTKEMNTFLSYYQKNKVVGENPCAINRICWVFEEAFGSVPTRPSECEFDYSILKSEKDYSKSDYDMVYEVYQDYLLRLDSIMKDAVTEKHEKDFVFFEIEKLRDVFRVECEEICPNEDELCNIVLDMCYGKESTKQFAWDICGDTIIKNLMYKNGDKVHYPKVCEDSERDFIYCGTPFKMYEVEKVVEDIDYIE